MRPRSRVLKPSDRFRLPVKREITFTYSPWARMDSVRRLQEALDSKLLAIEAELKAGDERARAATTFEAGCRALLAEWAAEDAAQAPVRAAYEAMLDELAGLFDGPGFDDDEGSI